eukprot:scaffold35723_cov18-Tisochrysis_lutea.AAC.6
MIRASTPSWCNCTQPVTTLCIALIMLIYLFHNEQVERSTSEASICRSANKVHTPDQKAKHTSVLGYCLRGRADPCTHSDQCINAEEHHME